MTPPNYSIIYYMANQEDIPQEHLFTMKYYPTDFFSSTNANDLPHGFEGCTILQEESKGNMCKTIDNDKKQNNTSSKKQNNTSSKKQNNTSSGEIYKCYQSELCKNKALANQLYNIRDNHYTSQERYENVKNKYYFEVVKTVNLLIGIIGVFMFIRANNKASA